MSKTVWKGLPRGFGKRAKTGKYMKEGTYKDTVEFEQFFQVQGGLPYGHSKSFYAKMRNSLLERGTSVFI